MGKRFTETNKWSDKWFRALGPFEKLGWQYLCDNCDAAGVIDLDRALADFQIGHSVEWDSLIEAAGVRVEVLESGKLWLTRFCDFQYGKLTEVCRPHRPVIALLQKYGLLERVLEGYQHTTNTPKDKDKEKEQEQDKEMEGVQGKPKPTPFDAWWEIVHCKTAKEAARKAYDSAVSKIRMVEPEKEPHAYLRERMLAFAATPSAKPTDRSPIHPATWLNQGRYADDPAAWNQRGSPVGNRPGFNHTPQTTETNPHVGI